jgi:hypothetical protein
MHEYDGWTARGVDMDRQNSESSLILKYLRQYRITLQQKLDRLDKLEREIIEVMGDDIPAETSAASNGKRRQPASGETIHLASYPITLKNGIIAILKEEGKPANVDRIKAEVLRKRYALDRENLYNSIYSALAKDKNLFIKTGPATFALKEQEDADSEG